MKKVIPFVAAFYLTAIFIILSVTHSAAFECSGKTYSDEDFERQKSSFTPYDKVFIMIECQGLTTGDHTLSASWIHEKEGLARSDSHPFTVSENDHKKRILFWFKLSRIGPLKSAFTNRDFYEKHFGNWTVEGFLDDTPVTKNKFEIIY
ncbi:MAG: hypothetical protein CSA26_07600 [Desulfobacterales bacterium]|nr:MAG: hypothetical protein CSA26_07600 [Desulfobacterales bacterium]